jgi:hypothetical protein
MSAARITAAVAAGALILAAAAHGAQPTEPPGFHQIETGPDGGTVLQGWIPDPVQPRFFRPTVVYLPPGYDPSRRYPVLYLLQGFPGSPYQFVDGIDLPGYADPRIAAGTLPPFVAVIPPAGIDAHHGDWTGVWESYLVDDVVPWADANLATLDDRDGRVLAGLSRRAASVPSTSGFAIPSCFRRSRPGAATSGRCGRARSSTRMPPVCTPTTRACSPSARHLCCTA